jgi:protein phosphatase
LSEEEARTHPLHSRIDQCLGGDAKGFAPEVGEFLLAEQDMLLLCSDGVVDGLFDADIRALLCAGQLAAVQAIAHDVVHEAVRRSGRDNTTAVIARVTAQESGSGSKRKTFFSRVPFFARSLNNSDS